MKVWPTLPAAPVTRRRGWFRSETLADTTTFRRLTSATAGSGLLKPPVDDARRQDDAAGHHVLPQRLADQVHGVEGDLHDAGADEHAEDRASPAQERAAAEHRRRDRVELVGRTERRGRAGQVRHVENAGHTREEGAGHEGDEANALHRYARQPRRLGI